MLLYPDILSKNEKNFDYCFIKQKIGLSERKEYIVKTDKKFKIYNFIFGNSTNSKQTTTWRKNIRSTKQVGKYEKYNKN